jgi:hypothetical protein
MPHYNVMGVAKAALEASVRYLAADLGRSEHPRQRVCRAGQDAGRLRHRRFPLYPEMEPVQFAAEAQRDDGGCRRRRPLSAVDLSAGVTGEIHHVDSGYHVVGMKAPRRARHLDASGSRHGRQQLRHLFRFTTWGESHGPAIGCVVDGVPPLIPLTEADIQPWLDKRRPASRASPPSGRSRTGQDPVRRVRGP